MTVFIAYMNYGIEEASRCIMATILMIDDDRPILELVKNGLEKRWTFSDDPYVRRPCAP